MTNPTNKYQTPVGLQQPAAADLSDGTTGTGAVVQAASPTLTGSPISTTPATGDSTTKIATTAFVTTAITNAVAGVNPAVAVQAATAAILPNSPTYLNGVGGIGATITTASTNVALVVDGYTPILNDRILVKNESGGLGSGKNGVYFVSQIASIGLAWILTRALDYDQVSDINSTGAIPVISGTVNTTTQWVLTSSITAVDGTQALTYAQFSANPSTLAPLASPAFTGTPTAPTAAVATNTTQLATTAFVIANSGAGGTDTLNVNTTVVVTPFSIGLLVNGVGPVGEVKVNSSLVSVNRPVIVQLGGNLTSFRTTGTVYQNTTGFPLYVAVDIFGSGVANVVVAGLSDSTASPATQVAGLITSNTVGSHGCITFIVMPGNFYKVTVSASSGLNTWVEWAIQYGSFSDSGDIHLTRSLGTNFHNTTTSTLVVAVQVSGASASSATTAVTDPTTPPVNQVDSVSQGSNTTGFVTVFFIVPPGHYYKVSAASGSLSTWHEYTWGIVSSRSLDYASSSGAYGITRQVAGISQALSVGGSSLSSVVPFLTINSNPTKVRWVQVICTNTSGAALCFLGQGESYPVPLNLFVVSQTSGSIARTLKGPVSPGCFYEAADQATGVLTTNHWWEYLLG
jgi:hypothetical protein